MTPTSRPEVLITDGGNGQSRSALAAVRALHAGGYRPVVTESPGSRSLAGASRFCARVVPTPAVDAATYAPAIRAELATGSYAALFATSDAALVALGLPGAALVDKRVVAQRVADAGLPSVPAWSFDDPRGLRAAAADLPFPVVVKPAVSRYPALRMATAADLDVVPADAGPVVAQPFLDQPMRSVSGVIRDGRLVAVVHQRYLRTWPTPCGTASAAVTTAPDLAVEERLPRLLDGYDGVFQIQLAGEYVLDLNPRVYGSMPLALAAGVNLPALSCVRPAPGPLLRARAGVHYRWVEGDVRNIVARLRANELSAREAWGALRPRRHTAHSVLAHDDLGPALARLRYALARRGPS